MEHRESQLNLLIAAGGTGGHLFPAQALALELLQNHPHIKVTFVGAGLKKNPYFQKEVFPFLDISSGTPFSKDPLKMLQAFLKLSKGVKQCLKYFRKQKPDLIVGFGSFHTFPAIFAAKIRKVPILIFESNAIPGRVNRFCSKWARVSAIQFFHASEYLKSKSICVQMPLLKKNATISKKEACRYFGLDEGLFTLLVFGGSQGAQVINHHFCSALDLLREKGLEFQVIHIVGNPGRVEKLTAVYQERGIRASVKPFEEKMENAWTAADLSISRAGAATLAEMIEFLVPSILIPYPYGTENHQLKNALFISNEIHGAVTIEEKELTPDGLTAMILEVLDNDQEKLKAMKRSLRGFKEEENKEDLCSVVLKMILKQHYHFLGVGGIGMSALARILIDQGQCVTGTDLAEIPTLEKIGVRKLEQLPKQGAVVYSSAIQESHPLLLQAKKEARPLFHRSLLLKELMGAQKALLVTGTHGKTTTSSLLTWVLSDAKKEPSFAVGGVLQNLQKNGGWGKGEYFIAEADESDGSFLNYQGEGGIVTNLEKEHLAYWKTEENLCKGFQTFFKQIKNHEYFFWCSDDPLLQTLKPPGISYGKRGELKLLTCQQVGDHLTFSASFRGKIYDAIQLPLVGEKLALNGLAVFGLALQLGVDEKDIRKAFLAFKGVKRRQEMLGQVNRIMVYDDYAHHPTEIKALLEGLRKKNPKGRLVALFEPHRFSRTKEQMEAFGDVFQEADLAVITSIYPAGESPIAGVTGKALANKVGRKKVLFIEKEKLMDFFPKMLLPGDLFVTMGAGGIAAFGPKLIKALS